MPYGCLRSGGHRRRSRRYEPRHGIAFPLVVLVLPRDGVRESGAFGVEGGVKGTGDTWIKHRDVKHESMTVGPRLVREIPDPSRHALRGCR